MSDPTWCYRKRKFYGFVFVIECQTLWLSDFSMAKKDNSVTTLCFWWESLCCVSGGLGLWIPQQNLYVGIWARIRQQEGNQETQSSLLKWKCTLKVGDGGRGRIQRWNWLLGCFGIGYNSISWGWEKLLGTVGCFLMEATSNLLRDFPPQVEGGSFFFFSQ